MPGARAQYRHEFARPPLEIRRASLLRSRASRNPMFLPRASPGRCPGPRQGVVHPLDPDQGSALDRLSRNCAMRSSSNRPRDRQRPCQPKQQRGISTGNGIPVDSLKRTSPVLPPACWKNCASRSSSTNGPGHCPGPGAGLDKPCWGPGQRPGATPPDGSASARAAPLPTFSGARGPPRAPRSRRRPKTMAPVHSRRLSPPTGVWRRGSRRRARCSARARSSRARSSPT